MSLHLAHWRRRLWLWLPALAFFVLNALALVVYQTRFAGRAEVSEEELAAADRELAGLVERRETREAQVASIGTTRAGLHDFYAARLSTEQKRLTELIAEVKSLAGRSRLRPSAISYPREAIEGFGLRKRSFVFRVEGGYGDLRTFINLLELSDSFLTLERVSLSESGAAAVLSIDLRLSTFFAVDGTPPLEGES